MTPGNWRSDGAEGYLRHRRGKKIMGSTMYRPSLLPMMMEMMQQNLDRLPFDKIVSNSFPLAEVNAAFEQAEWDNRHTSVTRAVLVP